MLLRYDKADTLKEKNDFGIGAVEQIKLIVLQSNDCVDAATAYCDLAITNIQPAHYVVDAEKVIKYAPSSTNLLDNTVKFTSTAQGLIKLKETTSCFDTETLNKVDQIDTIKEEIIDDNPNVTKAPDTEYLGNYINIVEICNGDPANYDNVARNLAKFLGYMINNHGFSTDNIWRAGDIIDHGLTVITQRDPYQYSHTKDFQSLLEAAQYCADHPDDPAPLSTYCFEPDDHENVQDHCPKAVCEPEHSHSGHIHHFEPDHRHITEITFSLDVNSNTMKAEDFTNRTINGSDMLISNFQPDVSQTSVSMESNYYEPIYPELTCPPRGATSLYNEGVTNQKQILKKMTAAEKKAQEKLINKEKLMDGYTEETEKTAAQKFEEEKIKPIIGKIPNVFDPYPVDDKIVQLEHHAPMVTLEYENAQTIQDNLTFYVINRFINTEKRLVALENILATQTRLINRMSSRVKINCVYYGGQSVFDKQAI